MSTAHRDASMSRGEAFKSLAERPSFYLIYLVFYAFPWIFQLPGPTDLAAAAIGVAVFLPIYFWSFDQCSWRRATPAIIAMEAIAFALSPFNGMAGVFHIYACTCAATVRPGRLSYVLIAALSAVFLAGSLLLGTHWVTITMSLFIGAMAGLSASAGADEIERRRTVERTAALDRELAAVQERERIARDLHDVLGHTLTLVALKAELAGKLMDRDAERAKRELSDIRNAARGGLAEVREAVAGMTLTTVDEEIDRARAALEAAGISFDVDGAPPPLDDRRARALGLAIREALTNVVRHSHAAHARLDFAQAEGAVTVTVADDGRGGAVSEGSGLTGLRQRIESVGGRMRLVEDRGLTVELELPTDAVS